MARRSPRIPELRQKNELKSMWGLYSILESCQGCHHSHKMISNGRPMNKHIVDYPRKIDQIPSFDEECQRIQSEAELASATVDASEGNFTQEDVPIEKRKTKQNVAQEPQHAKMDSELIDRLVKAHKRARKNSQKPYHSNPDVLMHQLPSSSAEISLNKLTITAILGAVLAQNHQEESSANAFVDKMFIDRQKCISREGTQTDSKSFSDALEVLNSNKALFAELLPDPNSQLARRIKNLHASQTAKETVKMVLDSSNCEEIGSALATQKGKTNKYFWGKIDKCEYSDKIVILKPVRQNAKHSDIDCHCSSLQYSHKKLSRRVSDAKTTPFSFREMKKKLKHTFTRKEPNQLSIRNSFDSSANEDREGKLWKTQPESRNDTARNKLDFSSVGLSNKQKFDATLEAKRQLSARLKNVNAVETVTYKKSPKTLERILSSPEHECLPLSPRRDSQSCSSSSQMRFSSCNISSGVAENSFRKENGRERACLSPLRPNSEVTSHIMDTETSSLISSTDEEEHDTDVCAAGNKKSTGELEIVKINDVTRTKQITNTIELQKNDENVFDSISNSPSTVDDIPSTPSCIHQLDAVDNTKYQEEHQSPVSVLEPFFTEDDANSPPSIKLQTGELDINNLSLSNYSSGPFADGQQLKPLRLDFEECSSKSFPQDISISPNSRIQEQYHLSQYVHWLLQASCLDWDHLSEIMSPPEDLLHSSLFDEMEFLPTDSYFDPKMLFDHINEILLELQQCHFHSSPWLEFPKLRIRPQALAEAVLDQIMTEADFYLLPRTEKRTLDQIVSKDVADCRSWLDVRFDTEQMVVEISEDVLEESILDILIEFFT